MLGVTGTGAFLRESAEKSRFPVADLHRYTDAGSEHTHRWGNAIMGCRDPGEVSAGLDPI